MRKRITGLLAAAVIVAGMASPALALTPEEEAILKNYRLQQVEETFQADGTGRNARATGQIAPPANCVDVVANMMPTADAVSNTVRLTTTVTGYATSFKLSYWRAACSSDASKSAVLVRISEIVGGASFLCGGTFKAIQNGATYDTHTLRTSGSNTYSSWCDRVRFDQTFILGQWSHLDQYDSQGAFTVYYDFIYHTAATANVPAYSGGPAPTTPGTQTPGTLYMGWWYNASQPGRGWGIGQHATSGKLYLGGFLYGSNGDQNWVVSNLGLVSTSSVSVNGITTTASLYQGDLIYCRDGQPLELTSAKAPNCTTAGTVAFQTSGARAAKLTINRSGFGAAMVTDLVPFDNF